MSSLYESIFGSHDLTKAQQKKLYGKIDDMTEYGQGTIDISQPDWIKKYDMGYSTVDDTKMRSRLGTTTLRATLEAEGILNPEQKLIIGDDPYETFRRKEIERILGPEDIKESETLGNTVGLIQLGNRSYENYDTLLTRPLSSDLSSSQEKRLTRTYDKDLPILISHSYIADAGDPFGSVSIVS